MKQGQLHLHTPFSDGIITLDDLMGSNYDFVAISDHDDTRAISAYQGLESVGIEVIPAVEISCFFYGKKLHVLSYWPDVENAEFQSLLASFRTRRRERSNEIIQRLQQNGLDLCIDDFQKYSGIIVKSRITNEVFAKPQNIKLLEEKGIHSREEFRKNYLNFGGHAYVALKREPAEHILPLAGGVLVLAHPGRNLDMGKDDFIIEALIKQFNIQGIEIINRQHTAEENIYYTNLAKNLNLIPTKSNDVHRPDQMQFNLDNYETVERLREKLKENLSDKSGEKTGKKEYENNSYITAING